MQTNRKARATMCMGICLIAVIILGVSACEKSPSGKEEKNSVNTQAKDEAQNTNQSSPAKSESIIKNDTTPAVSPDKEKEAESLYILGYQAYVASWKLDEALQYFEKALKADPNSYKAYNGKGIVLCYKKNYKDGMAFIQKALEIKPDFAYANFNMALAYKLQKNYEEAQKWFNKAISIDPKDTWSYFGIACIYAEGGDAPRAVEYLRKAIEIDPNVKEVANKEQDLDPIRNDPAFRALLK